MNSSNPQLDQSQTIDSNSRNIESANLSNDPNIINNELLQTDPKKEPEKHTQLLQKLQRTVFNYKTDQTPESSSQPSFVPEKAEPQETQPKLKFDLTYLTELVSQINPDSKREIEEIAAALKNNNLPEEILDPQIENLIPIIQNTQKEIQTIQAEAKRESTPSNSRTDFAKKIFHRLIPLPHSPQIESSLKSLEEIYNLENQTENLPTESEPEKSSAETTEAELISLDQQIPNLEKEIAAIQEKLKEIQAANQDLEKQSQSQKEQFKETKSNLEKGIEELPSNRRIA